MDIARSPQQLGAILRRYRKKGSLTQTDVAAKTQLRQATISALESGEAGTQLKTLTDVLAALDLELVVQPRSKSQPSDIEDLIWRDAN
jgi:HTH-type transcriptional regulator / antitoxin HipB